MKTEQKIVEKVIPLDCAVTLSFCGVEMYLMNPIITQMETRQDSSPFIRIEAQIQQQDFNEAFAAMQKTLVNERCIKDVNEGHCWCIECRQGAGRFVQIEKTEKINENIVDSSTTIGYYTGSEHGYYSLYSSWHKTTFMFWGSLNSLLGGSEYAVLSIQPKKVKDIVNENLDSV